MDVPRGWKLVEEGLAEPGYRMPARRTRLRIEPPKMDAPKRLLFAALAAVCLFGGALAAKAVAVRFEETGSGAFLLGGLAMSLLFAAIGAFLAWGVVFETANRTTLTIDHAITTTSASPLDAPRCTFTIPVANVAAVSVVARGEVEASWDVVVRSRDGATHVAWPAFTSFDEARFVERRIAECLG